MCLFKIFLYMLMVVNFINYSFYNNLMNFFYVKLDWYLFLNVFKYFGYIIVYVINVFLCIKLDFLILIVVFY